MGPVTVLFTGHKSEMVIISDRQSLKLRVIVDYNVGMKGVDMSEKVAQSYPTSHKAN